ncbi:MAG: transposase [Actinomycetia bacterium]|nr:transposase [Actinomycetes bacterium]
MKPVRVSRTVRLKVRPEANPGKQAALEATWTLWDRAVAFYLGFFLAHLGILAEIPKSLELLTWAETHTVSTPDHPTPLPGWDIEQSVPGVPVVFRRAAINSTIGAVRSYASNLKRWEAADPKRGQAPKPPRQKPHPTFYTGLYRVDMADFQQGFLRLKLFDGRRWQWFNLPVSAPPYAADLFAASAAEKERIRQIRQEQNERMRAEGRKKRTKEEKEALRPRGWVAQSPVLVHKPDGFWLHVPFEKWVFVAGKADEQRTQNPSLRVGTIDLNADSAVAAAWEGKQCMGVKTVWHTRENAKREKALQKVTRKQWRSGKPVKGEHSNRLLWSYIRNLDGTVAWQVAATIVAWAMAAGLSVLVFEYLRPYRPGRGLSWSRQTNRKRAYWLRGQVLRHVRDLALREGILVVERNPAWTSQVCPRCSRLGERFSPNGRGYPSRFRCGPCGWTGDANVVAAFNLKKKWDRSFRYPTQEERKAAELRRARKGGAAAQPKGLPRTG